MDEPQAETAEPNTEWEEPMLLKLPAKDATAGIGVTNYDGDSYS
jgi:hypothetical protein